MKETPHNLIIVNLKTGVNKKNRGRVIKNGVV